MSPFLESVLAELAGCATQPDFYRVMIRLQRYATPGDLCELASAASGAPRLFGQWLENFRGRIRAPDVVDDDGGGGGGHSLIELHKDVSLYRGASRGATLVVGFCGRAQMLFMPAAFVLPYFPAPRFDVLLLRDDTQGAYTKGIAGWAPGFDRLVERIAEEVRTGGYEGLRVVGSSGGGAPALAAGRLLGASSSVCVAGHLPSEWASYGTRPGAARIEEIFATPARDGARAWCVHGSECAPDAAAADRLARAAHAAVRAVEGVDQHNVLLPLHLAGALAALFADLGLGPRPRG